MSIEEILSQLQKLRWSGTRGYARCPGHDDQHSSLSLALGREQQLLVKCHAGCSFADICDALKASPADFFATPVSPLPAWLGNLTAQPRDDRIEATYDYVDETGRLLYQVVRYADKQFRQRRPDGAVWIWNLNGVRKVLYRLPELIATPPDEPILICEGEKDVDNLIALGLVATTGPGGAGKWQSEFGDFLRDREVVILPDNDGPGLTHAKLVCRALWGIAKTIRILELPGLPEHGDVSDWLAQGHEDAAMDLAALISASPYLEPKEGARLAAPARRSTGGAIPTARTVDLRDVEPQEVEWLWDRWVPFGRLSLVIGHPGQGKSWLTLAIASGVSRGMPLPGDDRPQRPKRVLLIGAEDGLADTVRPRLDALGADVDQIVALEGVVTDRGERGFQLGDTGALEEVLAGGDFGLVVLDPVTAFVGSADSYKDAEVRGLLVPLAGLAERYGPAVLGVMHLRKGQADNALQRASGSIAWTAAARSVLMVGTDPQAPAGGSERHVLPVKHNLCPPPQGLTFSLDGGRFTWGGPSTISGPEALLGAVASGEDAGALAEAKGWLSELLADGPVDSRTVEREAKVAGVAWATVRRAKSVLGVCSRRKPEAGRKRGEGGWEWALPADQGAQGAQGGVGEHLDPLGAAPDLKSAAAGADQDAHLGRACPTRDLFPDVAPTESMTWTG